MNIISNISSGNGQLDPHTKTNATWAYKQLEATVDGIVDFKLEDVNGERKTLIGIRYMRNVSYDSKWHSLKIGETAIEK